ncbi:MAG: right-handed parallel beta-helix repeat-containing protein [Deltaproteobacteria bacterium]|nr:right-handed parallel beta-helix repeat-containing protein [Deltaproteobacteria bacterium]
MWLQKTTINLVAGLMVLLLTGPVLAQELNGTVRWSGEVSLDETVLVHRDATLIIAAGTQLVIKDPKVKISVQGILQVNGTKTLPVSFTSPSGWEGIEFMEAPAGSVISWARFHSAKAAIVSFETDFLVENCTFEEGEFGVRLMRESSPKIVDSLFKNNQIGIANEMKSGAEIRGNRFVGQLRSAVIASHNSKGLIIDNHFEKNKQGIALQQRYPDRISKNTFIENETAIFCNQTQNTPMIEQNYFEGNDSAVLNFSFSFPVIKNNTFVKNKTAVHNDQYGSPLVENNLFRDNDTALYNYRKSNPKVFLNDFEQNRLAILCDFSAYPKVKNNNFLGNQMAVKLGIYQSADWEKRSGSKPIMQRESAARKSQNPLLAKAPDKFNDFVDVSGNWWGDDTLKLEQAGEGGNTEMFYDRHDLPEVTYENYGPGVYKLDRIHFSPWLTGPVEGTGVKTGTGIQTEIKSK